MNDRLETITKKRGAELQSMLQNGNVSDLFSDTQYLNKGKGSSITRFSNVRIFALFRCYLTLILFRKGKFFILESLGRSILR